MDLVISYEWSDTLVWLLCPDGYSLRVLAFVNASGSTHDEDLVDLVISYEWSDTLNLVWLLCPDGYSLRLLAFVNASGSTQNGRTCRTSP